MKIKLIDICTPKQWKTLSTSVLLDDGYSVYGANGIIGYYNEYNHENETVMVTCRGATCGTVNKSEPFSYISGNAMCMDNVREDVETDYLYYVLKHYDFSRVISGTAQPQITRQGLSKVDVKIVPRDKQKRIISVLKITEKLIDFKYNQIQEYDQLIKSRFVEMFGDPYLNDMNWTTKELQDVVTDDCTISYGIVQTGDNLKEGIPVFRPIDIVNNIPRRSSLKKTSVEISNKYKKTVLKGRELLITVRANIGDTYIIDSEFTGCNVGRGIVPIRTQENILNLDFLKYQLDNECMKREIKDKAKGITLIQLNMIDLRRVSVIVPKRELQLEFTGFVKQVDKLKFAVQKSLEETQTLFDSLMQEYFG